MGKPFYWYTFSPRLSAQAFKNSAHTPGQSGNFFTVQRAVAAKGISQRIFAEKRLTARPG
ncbi:hypothetical protein D8B20_14435 [Candidatus Pantoea soli]|uniref:Uncharacterized protein n=2 Tax=Candidatus Pantoea soli TaxID=3098669 RepID=A0A518XFN0_9GAMM|nr:hypothetical protein D8B20_14435 [Pantoea soli]